MLWCKTGSNYSFATSKKKAERENHIPFSVHISNESCRIKHNLASGKSGGRLPHLPLNNKTFAGGKVCQFVQALNIDILR